METHSAFRLDGKTVLITGASSGIGRATALACAESGGKIILNGRNAKRLIEVHSELAGIGHKIEAFDLTDLDQLNNLSKNCPDLDGLIHCAGVDGVAPMRQVQSKMLTHVMNINYMAPILLTQKLLISKKIRDKASILFLSSIAAKTGKRGVGPYSGTKAALIGSMRPLALEVAKYGIRVNALCPGIVRTPIFEGQEQWLTDEVALSYPLGIGEPEDVANAALFFMSDASQKITGTDFSLDGGVVIT